MSTIADYSVFTKAFLASNNVDFSKLYGKLGQDGNWGEDGAFKAFAVVPLDLDRPLTPREAMNFDWSKLGTNKGMRDRISCQDANGNFIGNIVRIQPGKREGSIRLVAKVAVPAASAGDVADIKVNTFVLLRTDASTNEDLPIAVATISAGYTLHKHLASGNDPLDDVENANYVSFTINHLNGYTSVDFNPDAYATYDDVANALSRGIDGLHIAFNSNTGDIILSDSKGNVIDQANLHLDLSADTIIAEGEEGYKYVKTDINQNVHSAKAFMPSGSSAFGDVKAVTYKTKHASLVRFAPDDTHVCNGIRVCWKQAQEGSEQATQHDEIYWVGLTAWNDEGDQRDCIALNCSPLQNGQLGEVTCKLIRTTSKNPIRVTSNSSIYSEGPSFNDTAPVYDHDAFVHTVGNSSLADWDECFKLMGFHVGDDIPLGTDLPALMQVMTSGKLDPEEFIHGENADNAAKVVTQRENAKEEMAEYNKRRPDLVGDRNHGTIIDSAGLDVRDGCITLGCGRVGTVDGFQKVNYGIQMKERPWAGEGPNPYGSLDFTVSYHTGELQFDENGHAVRSGGNGLVPLASSTLLSIEAGSYISGAPTCLILAKVARKPKDGSIPEGTPDPLEGSPVLIPVRTTAGFSVAQNYDASSGLGLTLHDDRDNILGILNHDGRTKTAPAIIEVQAIYTHRDANLETVPAQQMHTYIGAWIYGEKPYCSFLCNKIEEWMTAIDLTDTSDDPYGFTGGGVGLYVVIRVY